MEKTLSRLPSTGTKNGLMLVEAKRVVSIHVAEAVLEDQENPLHGTSKFHRLFQGFQFSTSCENTLSAVITEVGSGDADSLLQKFKLFVSELSQSVTNATQESTQSKKTCSTMSGQCSVIPSFNKKLAAFKDLLVEYLLNKSGFQ